MTDQKNVEARPDRGAGTPAMRTTSYEDVDLERNCASRAVAWFEVYSFAERFAASHDVALNHLPIPGTPAWCGMPDDDARKLMALVLGGVREALNHEVAQERRADASREISAAADWTALSQRIRNRASGTYIPRRREGAA